MPLVPVVWTFPSHGGGLAYITDKHQIRHLKTSPSHPSPTTSCDFPVTSCQRPSVIRGERLRGSTSSVRPSSPPTNDRREPSFSLAPSLERVAVFWAFEGLLPSASCPSSFRSEVQRVWFIRQAFQLTAHCNTYSASVRGPKEPAFVWNWLDNYLDSFKCCSSLQLS